MLLYRFLDVEFALKSIREKRLRISRIHELNDPFEFLGADLSCPEKRSALRTAKQELSRSHGLICFSKTWTNPVLWGHYADRHRGICLGFEIPDDLPRQVSYVNSRFTWPTQMDENFVMRLLFTKFVHWSYEDEYRVYASLNESENGHYFYNFSKEMKLKRLIVGPESDVSRDVVLSVLADIGNEVEIFKARAAFRSFQVVRNKDESLWN